MDPRRTIRRGLTLTTIAGLAGALLAGPAAGDDGGQSAPPPGPDWAQCPADVVTTVPLECATVPVPLDHDDPDGEQIEIMISRLASADPEKRQGVLLLNPGGPGGSGLSQPADLQGLGIPSSVLDAYDLIGMDPRGVGHSSPVSCGFTAEQNYPGNIPPYAPDDAAVAEQAAFVEEIAAQCAAHDTDGRMRHMSTDNTARDMDLIREALGEKKLSFYGASYGSALGGAYASLFPERGGRIVIDSNLGATSLDRDSHRRFGPGMEKRFPDFARWAAERHESYELGRTPAAVRENYLATADRLDREPSAGVDGSQFRFLLFVMLYKEARFGAAGQFWQSVADGDTEAVRSQTEELRELVPGLSPAAAGVAMQPGTAQEPGADEPRGQETKAEATPSPFDNAWSAYLAVTCNDTDWPKDVETYRRDVAADREQYPLFGGAGANITPCAFWHHDRDEPPLELNPEGPDNVLVLQNLRDPATPHLGGRIARAELGDRARLVSVDAGNHGVYVYDDNPCALNTTTKFLLDGKLPKSDVFCAASTSSGLALDRSGLRERANTLARLGL
ncbi:alpha/beta hydrolase [Promicromonospora sukumoe]|uniref:alpha/beta hydrolase n=1 Tax=Promicromonospora sukumoe TaxID=88382 RepID=UPI00036CF7A6|nr:alpha/beta hydrolase [Promicromonospora sukumoe]